MALQQYRSSSSKVRRSQSTRAAVRIKNNNHEFLPFSFNRCSQSNHLTSSHLNQSLLSVIIHWYYSAEAVYAQKELRKPQVLCWQQIPLVRSCSTHLHQSSLVFLRPYFNIASHFNVTTMNELSLGYESKRQNNQHVLCMMCSSIPCTTLKIQLQS